MRAAALALSAAAAAVCVFHDYEADRRILSAGAYRGGSAPHAGWKAFKDAHDDGELLYYKDGLQATVAVVRSPSGPLSLRVNGKVDASTGADMGTQLLIAHLPLVLRPKARDVLLVGLGSGITAGAVLAHPVERLSVVEIDEAVVEAERFFREHNGRPLSDPRLTLRVADAKVALRSDPRPYDLIISEPSNPWLAGMGNLFTVEFYRAAKAKLRPGGAMVQWFHLYEMDDETVRLILRTYASVFSEVTAWTSPAGDLLLIGTDRTHGGDPKGLEDAFERPAVAADLRRIGVRSLTTLLSLEAATDETVRGIAGRGPLNSDMHPHLEYRAPRAFFMRTRAQVMDRYDDRLRPGAPLVIWDYLAERGRGLAVRELAEIAAFARLIGGRWGAYFRTRA